MKKMLLLILIIVSSFLLISCTKQSEKPVAEIVLNKYYTAVIAGDYGTAYECLSIKTKSAYSMEKFKENHELLKKAYGVTKFEIVGTEGSDQLKTFKIKTTGTKPDSNIPEPAFVTLEDNQYKMIYMGEMFNELTALACHQIAFDNLYSKERDFDYIIHVSKKAIELDPENEFSYCDLARAYSLSGNMIAGLEAIDEYINLYPGFTKNDKALAEMYSLKGLNLVGQHKMMEAKAAYQKSLQLDPTDKNTNLSLQELNS
ncbi:MAG TPA: hypothetical protein VFC84_08570 [Desulfosporosinus sp.]|nr:hypothetical protein [Desulfosporosinus sp.]